METVYVGEQADMQEAAKASAHTDVLIYVAGNVDLDAVRFPNSANAVHIEGCGTMAGLTFKAPDSCDWSTNPAAKAANGVEVNCRRLTMERLHISGFDWFGAALKVHGASVVEIHGCDFVNIGIREYEPRILQPVSATDVVLVQAVAGWAHIFTCTECKFYNVARCWPVWCHALYMDADYMTIKGCEFWGCGSAMNCSGLDMQVRNNRDMHPVANRHGQWGPWYVPVPRGPQAWVGNEFAGARTTHWWGHFDDRLQTWLGNYYAGIVRDRPDFAIEAGIGGMDYATWSDEGRQ